MIRRRTPAEEPEPDRLHFNDPLGTIKAQSKPTRPGNPVETYLTSAEGEPLQAQTTDMPSNVRFHGGYLEGKEFNAASGTDRGHLYRMGVRHYSPALGRFLQRDAIGSFRGPNAEWPLTANPYAYGFNQPLQYTDASGYQACCPVGGLAGGGYGAGEPIAPGADGGEAGCRIGWPDPVCACYSNQACCVHASDPITPCNPCASTTVVHVICPPSDWTGRDCYCWCCEQRSGGEYAPTRRGRTTLIGRNGPLEPPEYGPGGDGGDIWGVLPPWARPTPPPSSRPRLLRTGAGSQFMALNAVLPSFLTPGALWGFAAGIIWDLLAELTADCMPLSCGFDPENPVQTYLYQCFLKACCDYRDCLERAGRSWNTLKGVLGAGLGYFLGGAIGSFGGPIGGIIGSAMGGGFGWRAGRNMCLLKYVADRAACLVGASNIAKDIHTWNPSLEL